MLRNTIRITFLLIFIAAVGTLVYVNFYEQSLYGPALVGTIVAGVLWYLVTYQFLTEKGRPGVITSKTDAAVSRAHAEKLKADAEVEKAETEIIKSRTTKNIAVLEQQEAENKFQRTEEFERAIHQNRMLVMKRANELQVSYEQCTAYLMKMLEERIKYETAALIAEKELEAERAKLSETIRFTLQEGSMKFDESFDVNDQLVVVEKKLKKSRTPEEKQRLERQKQVLEAKWHALIGQIDIPEADGAKA